MARGLFFSCKGCSLTIRCLSLEPLTRHTACWEIIRDEQRALWEETYGGEEPDYYSDEEGMWQEVLSRHPGLEDTIPSLRRYKQTLDEGISSAGWDEGSQRAVRLDGLRQTVAIALARQIWSLLEERVFVQTS